MLVKRFFIIALISSSLLACSPEPKALSAEGSSEGPASAKTSPATAAIQPKPVLVTSNTGEAVGTAHLGHNHSHEQRGYSSAAKYLSETASLSPITVYKSPTCGCCSKWVTYLETAGFNVTAIDRNDMPAVKASVGLPIKFQSCHTATVDGYVVEGHVPAADIIRMLKEKPEIAGLAVPGMPKGSPGMEHPRPEHYATLAFQENGEATVFEHHGP